MLKNHKRLMLLEQNPISQTIKKNRSQSLKRFISIQAASINTQILSNL
jgi:hypothetical protein